MDRREFVKSASLGLFTPILGSTSVQLASQPESDSITAPEIPIDILNERGWEKTTSPTLPGTIDIDEEILDETNWKFTAYIDSEHRSYVNTQTEGVVNTDFKHIWATKVNTTDEWGRQVWWEAAGDGEWGESLVGIDGVTEEVFETYVTDTINGGRMDIVAEGHRKVLSWVVELPSFIPYAGPVISHGIDFIWDARTTLNFSTGGSAYLSQYLLDYPVTQDSLNADESLPNTSSLDVRGWYVDWFKDGVFHAAGGIYPQNAENLSERLSDAFEDEIIIEKPEMAYGEEIVYLLSHVQ